MERTARVPGPVGRRDFLRSLLWGSTTLLAAKQSVGQQPARPVPAAGILQLPRQDDLSEPPIVTAVALHPSGREVALGGDDHTVQIWDLAKLRLLRSYARHGDWVRALAYSPDGCLLASAANDGRLLWWDALEGHLRREQKTSRQLRRLVFDREGERLMSIGFGDSLRTFDVASGTAIGELACPCDDMRALTVSPDNRWIAAGGRDGRIRIWNANGKVQLEFAAHRRRIHDLKISADSRRIFSCGEDRRIRISRLDGRRTGEIETGTKTFALARCGASRLAAGGADNLVRIWDLTTLQETARLPGHTGTVAALCCAGETLVSAGFDTEVRTWRLDNLDPGAADAAEPNIVTTTS